MTQLVVVTFPDPSRAYEVHVALARLAAAHMVEFADAAVLRRSEDGKVHVDHKGEPAGDGPLGGGLLGLLLAGLLMSPLLGLVVGSAGESCCSWCRNIGLSDDFVQQLRANLGPGHSALFVLVRRGATDRLVEHLAAHRGTLACAHLTPGDADPPAASAERARGAHAPPASICAE